MSHDPPRYPIETIRHLAPLAPVRLGGRIVEVGSGRAVVQDSTGSIEIRCDGAPPLGAWVIASGTWNGHRLDDGTFRPLNVPRVPFPREGGDWSRLQTQQSRRLRLLKSRAAAARAVRDFFDQRAFVEVETPAMVPSPGLEVHLDAFAVEPAGDPSHPRWLITSPEYQMKRLLCGGMNRIYQMCKCFRRGEVGGLHQPEFTMVEWYRAFAGSKEVMRDIEELVAHVAGLLHDGSTIVPARNTPVDVTPPWERITVREAFERHAGIRVDDVLPDEERFFRILVEQVEPQLGQGRPVFMTEWPASMASLARLDPRNPEVADRFEAYVAGVEICNGFGELTDPLDQRERFERDQRRRSEQGKPVYPVDERFVAALEEGLPPSGGNALGFDRLVMLLVGAAHIEDVLAVPHSRL